MSAIMSKPKAGARLHPGAMTRRRMFPIVPTWTRGPCLFRPRRLSLTLYLLLLGHHFHEVLVILEMNWLPITSSVVNPITNVELKL